ncbi:hypothetical protein [Fischerella sp. PCC 9605]|uniref:hypothetical protein n=1 Tax=Fischerella sp. PCC 9605 TaxID=1173024 RepID=UPI0004B48BA0|nr:hypothetical protein [Fischerella sp. PCC 9605]
MIESSRTAQPEAPAVTLPHNKSFKVGTFNLFNLVLPDVIYYEKNKYSTEVYQRKKIWISRQLEHMEADIIGFQELFHQQALGEILAQTKMYADAQLVAANPTGDKPVVALLS